MGDDRTTTALIILDGWGHSDTPDANAIHAADTPVWDALWRDAPHTLISGSGEDVGLPGGQMGNSEVGHMNLGAGRVVYQDFTRISLAVRDGSFAANPALCAAIDTAAAQGATVHLFGLLSPGGVHSHEEHIQAAVRLAAERGAKSIAVHAFLDGRDTPPRSAAPSLAAMDALYAELGVGRTATVSGRYYAMDRDNRWERVQAAWSAIVDGAGQHSTADAASALEAAYARGEDDEFVAPTVVAGGAPVADGDVIVFMNFRADRARQITRAFVLDDFDGFERARRPQLADFVMLTQYAADIPASCAYAPETLDNTFGAWLSGHGLTQLRIAETEKYAHVTFFFNGGREDPFEGEDRDLVPSPDVATYDLQPEMSAFEVTDRLVAAIRERRYDAIICNFANGDMVGHTGNFDAAVQAVEAVDECLGRIRDELVEQGGQMLITADHGNVEQMRDESTGQAHTAHTCEPVPLIYVGPQAVGLDSDGVLSDVAPTLLALMDLPQPADMTGRSLAKLDGTLAA